MNSKPTVKERILVSPFTEGPNGRWEKTKTWMKYVLEPSKESAGDVPSPKIIEEIRSTVYYREVHKQVYFDAKGFRGHRLLTNGVERYFTSEADQPLKRQLPRARVHFSSGFTEAISHGELEESK